MATNISEGTLVADRKVQENRVRRIAERQGLRIAKSRRRDQLARDYGLFWVVDPEGPKVNDPDWPFDGRPAHGFPWLGADLNEVEQFLKTRPEDR